MGKRAQILYITIALVLLFSVGSLSLLLPQREFSEMENRYLQRLPALGTDALLSGVYMARFEEFAADQFPARDVFVRLKAEGERLALKHESGGAYFGAEGFLIEKPEPLSESVTQLNLETLRGLSEEGFKVTAMLVPTAAQMLKELLPEGYDDAQSRLIGEALEYLEGSGVSLVDPTALFAANDPKTLYYRTDHHWTTRGAFLGYTLLSGPLSFDPWPEEAFTVQVLSEDFYGTTFSKAPLFTARPDTIEAYVEEGAARVYFEDRAGEPEGLYHMEALETKDQYSVFLSGNQPLLTIETESGTGKTLAVFKDSYAHALIPFLTLHYDTIYVFDLRYYNLDPLSFLLEKGVRDILVLYNAQNFGRDPNFAKILIS